MFVKNKIVLDDKVIKGSNGSLVNTVAKHFNLTDIQKSYLCSIFYFINLRSIYVKDKDFPVGARVVNILDFDNNKIYHYVTNNTNGIIRNYKADHYDFERLTNANEKFNGTNLATDNFYYANTSVLAKINGLDFNNELSLLKSLVTFLKIKVVTKGNISYFSHNNLRFTFGKISHYPLFMIGHVISTAESFFKKFNETVLQQKTVDDKDEEKRKEEKLKIIEQHHKQRDMYKEQLLTLLKISNYNISEIYSPMQLLEALNEIGYIKLESQRKTKNNKLMFPITFKLNDYTFEMDFDVVNKKANFNINNQRQWLDIWYKRIYEAIKGKVIRTDLEEW